VLDASVALKWALNDEEHVYEAIALRDDWVHGVCADQWLPRFFIMRLLTVCVRRCERGG